MFKAARYLANYGPYYATHPRLAREAWRTLAIQAHAWSLNRAGQGAYPHYDTSGAAIRARRTSDTLFIFGAGTSLHEISAEEWAHIDAHNTLGWNLFAQQRFVHADMHIFRETHATDLLGRLAETQAHIADVRENPYFEGVTWLIQGGWRGVNGNLAVGLNLLPSDTPIMRFVNQAERGTHILPGEHFDGIAHGAGTLTDAVNLGYLGGWRKIVLLGIDLYNMRYFVEPIWEKDPAWVAENPDLDAQHRTAQFGIVTQMRRWHEWLQARDVALYVQNPRSLLAEFLPVYDWRTAEHLNTTV